MTENSTKIQMENIDKYEEWIKVNYPTRESQLSECGEATEKMVKAFPELTRVRGHYVCIQGERPHWWCLTPDNTIIDPTKDQFNYPGFYVPWIEGTKEPTGICPNCGDYCYDGKYCCCENCDISYVAYCNSCCR